MSTSLQLTWSNIEEKNKYNKFEKKNSTPAINLDDLEEEEEV